MTIFLNVLQPMLIILGAPALRGLVALVKARLQGRRGASIWRPYWEIIKLFQKDDLVPPTASVLFRASPRITFCATAATALFVPALQPEALLGGKGDIILLVYLLALARFFLVLGAMDGGGAFGGMGGSREVLVSALAEAPLLLSLIAPAILAQSTHLAEIVAWTLQQSFFNISAGHLLAFFALAIVTLAETGRIPVDNPTTHLELTMIHEAMVLEHSGPSLAFLEGAHAIKLNLLLSLSIGLFFPWGMTTDATFATVAIAALAYAGKLAALAVILAVVESGVAKMRMYAVPDFLGVASALSVMGVVFTAIGRK
jgi:formate hydrogenlyase subunit 4